MLDDNIIFQGFLFQNLGIIINECTEYSKVELSVHVGFPNISGFPAPSWEIIIDLGLGRA
jgi:hypothetical protein